MGTRSTQVGVLALNRISSARPFDAKQALDETAREPNIDK
jgi:hypothetical protein